VLWLPVENQPVPAVLVESIASGSFGLASRRTVAPARQGDPGREPSSPAADDVGPQQLQKPSPLTVPRQSIRLSDRRPLIDRGLLDLAVATAAEPRAVSRKALPNQHLGDIGAFEAANRDAAIVGPIAA
jgi:hypothetical protein